MADEQGAYSMLGLLQSSQLIVTAACRVQDIANVMAMIPSLQFLDLSHNLIRGNLSEACSLAKTGSLEQIALAHNNISGSIPGCITNLKNLVEFHLDDNRLTGSVPLSSNAKISKLVYFTAANQVQRSRM